MQRAAVPEGLTHPRVDPIVMALVAGLRSIERQRREVPANVELLRDRKRPAA